MEVRARTRSSLQTVSSAKAGGTQRLEIDGWDSLTGVGLLATRSCLWMSVACQTGRTRVEQRRVAILRVGPETCLICVRAVLAVDAPMHLTVTDMCQTVSKLAAYLHLCIFQDVS